MSMHSKEVSDVMLNTSLLSYIMEPDFDYEQIDKVFQRILYGNEMHG